MATVTFSAADDLLYAYLAGEIDHDAAQNLRIQLDDALLTRSPENADRFVTRMMGDLRTAPPEIIEAVRAFIAQQCNASRAAERLFTHRNTILRRLARADQLLPRPLADNTLEVGAALEILHWRGQV